MRVALASSRSFGNVVTIGNDLLRDAGFEVRRVSKEERPLDEAKLISIVHREGPEVIITGAEPMSETVLAASDSLRMIMKHGVGVDNIDLGAATSRGITVANTPGTNTEAVADLALGLMLFLLRRACAANASTHSGGWKRYVGHELGAMTVGVVGPPTCRMTGTRPLTSSMTTCATRFRSSTLISGPEPYVPQG